MVKSLEVKLFLVDDFDLRTLAIFDLSYLGNRKCDRKLDYIFWKAPSSVTFWFLFQVSIFISSWDMAISHFIRLPKSPLPTRPNFVTWPRPCGARYTRSDTWYLLVVGPRIMLNGQKVKGHNISRGSISTILRPLASFKTGSRTRSGIGSLKAPQ